MPKQDYDNFVARQLRPVCYKKSWHLQGLRALTKLKLKNFSMLDIGCGNGEFSEMAKRNFNADVTCMDYAESHLERVKNLGFKTVRCNFDSKEDVNNIKKTFKNTFDVIVAFEVIEHVFAVDTLLSAIHTLLKNNGILIISTPNMSYFRYRIYSLLLGNIPISEGHHIRFFNPSRLQQFLFLNSFDFLYNYSYGKVFDSIYDYSGGNFVYYLDEIIGEKKQPLRSFCIRALFKLSSLLIPASSASGYSTILFVAKRADTVPLGLSPLFRNAVYSKLSEEEKEKAIGRLLPLRKKLFFNEYPGLRRFIDTEAKKLGKDSGKKELNPCK